MYQSNFYHQLSRYSFEGELEQLRAMRLSEKGKEVFVEKDGIKVSDRYLMGRWVRSRCKISVKWFGEQLE